MVKRKPRPYEECHKIVNGVEFKLCSDCNEWLLMTNEFYTNKKAPDGHNPYCKICTIARSRARQLENHEEYTDYLKQWVNENKSLHKEMKKDWASRNQDKLKESLREWQINNPDRVREHNMKRMEHKKHKISKKEWESCKRYFNYECAYCGMPDEIHKKLYKQQLHKEHVSHDGENDLSNCIPSCKICNSSKHTDSLDVWYTEDKDFYSVDRLNRINKWLNDDYKLYIKPNTL